MTKQMCSSCKLDLLLDKFTWSKDRGFRKQCKSCVNKQIQERRKKDPSTGRKNSRDYYNRHKNNPNWMTKLKKRIYKNREKNPGLYKAIRDRYISNNREKVKSRNKYYDSLPEEKARRKLRIEVKKGNIKRPERCSACSILCKPHGHHHDYSLPLEVTWLCPKCHGLAHRT